MGQPTAQEIQFAIGAMRDEASIWGAEGPKCTSLAGVVQGLSMSGLEAGLLFQVYLQGYRAVCTLMESVLTSGGQVMGEISTTLAAAATTYENEEKKNIHAVQGKW